MFPDCRIAAKFSCGRNKCSGLIDVGLAPCFKDLLLGRVKENGARGCHVCETTGVSLRISLVVRPMLERSTKVLAKVLESP